MVAGEAIAVVAQYVGWVVEEASVRIEIIGTARPPSLVNLRPARIGHVDGDLGFFDTFVIDFAGRFERAARRGHEYDTARDDFMDFVDDPSPLTPRSLHQPIRG
ncbi:MAG: hypothetical protein PVSMB1_18310 [Gemmatimonadaceae bacterium]